MFHVNTDKLIAEWRRQRTDSAGLPPRAAISPVAFGPLLPQLFILGLEHDGAEAFRLAGGLLADLHGRDLRGADFFSLWRREDRSQMQDALERARQKGALVVATATASTPNGDTIALEITLAPLVGESGAADRVIGLYQPVSISRHLTGKPISKLAISALHMVENGQVRDQATARSHLRLVVSNGRRVA